MQSTVYDSRKQRFFIGKKKIIELYIKEKSKKCPARQKTGESKKEKKV